MKIYTLVLRMTHHKISMSAIIIVAFCVFNDSRISAQEKLGLSGNVGIGTESPATKLEILHDNSAGDLGLFITGSISNSGDPRITSIWSGGSGSIIDAKGVKPPFGLHFYINGSEKMRIRDNGYVGIGTLSPSYKLHVNGDAGKPGGGSWSVASDRRLKDTQGNFTRGLESITNLRPVYYRYKENNPIGLPSAEQYIGLIAQEVKKVIPEAVDKDESGFLTLNNDPIIWAMVNSIRELKSENDELKLKMHKIEQVLDKMLMLEEFTKDANSVNQK